MDLMQSFVDESVKFFGDGERLKASFVAVFGVYTCVALAHIILPGLTIEGYACDRQGKTLSYKINGIPVIVLSVVVFHWVSPNRAFFCDNYYYCWFWGNVFGLLGSLYFYVKGRKLPEHLIEYGPRSRTKDCPVTSSTAADKAAYWQQGFFQSFYVGLEFNPRHRFVSTDFDWKMWLYLVGAVMLELVVLSTVAVNRRENGGQYSLAAVVGGGMWTWFVFEYIYHEHVHLYTYDIFAERLGFKLIWGCLAWYPFFYSIGLRCLTVPLGDSHKDITGIQAIFIVTLFLFGWALTRGANMQKYCFKIAPEQQHFLGMVPQRSLDVRTTSGSPRRILISGWWGVARHVNYLGEMIQGAAFALPGYLVTSSPQAWLYCLFITSILTPRQSDDDELCRRKYGAMWDEYARLVPYRIIPYVY